jgi:hypothetical protein
MRHALLSIAAWAGVLQSLNSGFSIIDGAARLIGIASVLGTFTVLVYKLGVWRQQMENTKDTVIAELKSGFDRLERQLDRLERP